MSRKEKTETATTETEEAMGEAASANELDQPAGAHAIASADAHADEPRGRRKVRQGKVVANKMEQTVVVAIASTVRHPLYGKTIRRTTRFKAHDQDNTCNPGDTVEIMETRPISKEKHWRVVRVVERAK